MFEAMLDRLVQMVHTATTRREDVERLARHGDRAGRDTRAEALRKELAALEKRG